MYYGLIYTKITLKAQSVMVVEEQIRNRARGESESTIMIIEEETKASNS